MLKLKTLLTIVAVLGCSAGSAYSQVHAERSDHELLVKFKTAWSEPPHATRAAHESPLARIDARFNRTGSEYIGPHQHDTFSYQRMYLFEFANAIDIDSAVQAYFTTGLFTYVEPNFIGHGAGHHVETNGLTPNDQYFFYQWGLKNTGMSIGGIQGVAGIDIDMPDAWQIEQGDSSIIVAFVDSGVKLDHPELAGRIWHNIHETAGNGNDDDHNGYIDDVNGWNFMYHNSNVTDDFGHGTNVAGIVGANGNNGVGYAGVDWKCKLMIVKGLDSNNSGTYAAWISGIHYAVDNGARVINLSLEGMGASASLQDAITYAYNHGVMPVACMGNFDFGSPSYPAACIHAFGVGSIDPNGYRSEPFPWSSTSGSDWGPDIKVMGPGNYIYGLSHTSNTDYSVAWCGTSQATPHVVGLASLLLAQDPKRTVDTVEAIIERTATDLIGKSNEDTPGWDQYFGYGLINAYKALRDKLGVATTSAAHTAISVYPNPATRAVTIDAANAAMLQAELVDEVGRTVATNMEHNSRLQFDVSHISAGVYFFRIRTTSGMIVQSLVIQH